MPDRCQPPNQTGCALTLLLLDAARSVEARAEALLEGIDLSLAKVGALRHLVIAAEPLSLTQLAERHCCGRSNITQLVDRLEADGMVERLVDPLDRRTVRAAVTSVGRAAYERANDLLAQHEEALTDRLGASRRAELAKGLKVLREG